MAGEMVIYNPRAAATRLAVAARRVGKRRYRRPYIRARRLPVGMRGTYRRAGRWANVNAQEPEHKYLTGACLTGYAVTAAGAIASNDLVTIPEGVGPEARTGRQVMLTRVAIKGTIHRYYIDTAINQVSNVYIYLVQDTQCNGLAATVGSDTAGIFTINDLSRAFQTPLTYNRFKILAKKKVTMNAIPVSMGTTAVDTDTLNMRKQFYLSWGAKKGAGIPIEYNAATGVLASRTANNVFLVVGHCGAILSDSQLEIDAHQMIKYYDA